MKLSIAALSGNVLAQELADLVRLLRDCVEGGASVGFLWPLSEAEAAVYWQEVLAEVVAGKRLVLVARSGKRIIGSVQLGLASRTNSRHRADVQKLLVLRSERGRGQGLALMQAAEAAAKKVGRSLLVLDTSATGNALNLYQRCGYIRVGIIPRFASDPDGSMIDTVVYYKELSSS